VTLWDSPSGDELSDDDLDAMLAKADQELLDHVRRYTHPADALLAMMDANTAACGPEDTELPLPEDRSMQVPGGLAITIIDMRAQTRDVAEGLERLRTAAVALAEVGACALELKDRLAEAEVTGTGRHAVSRSPRPRRQLALLAALAGLLLDGGAGYVSLSGFSGRALAGLLGGVVSVAVLAPLELLLASTWGRWIRFSVGLALGLGLYAGGIAALRYLVLAPGSSAVTATGLAVLVGCTLIVVLVCSAALIRLGARHRRPGGSLRSSTVTVRQVSAVVGIRSGRVRFTRMLCRLETPVFGISALIERSDLDFEFHRELDEIYCLVLDMAARADGAAEGNDGMRSLGASLARLAYVLENLKVPLVGLDEAVIRVRSQVGQVVPLYLVAEGSRTANVIYCKQDEVSSRVSRLANCGVAVSERAEGAAEDIGAAMRFNPVRQLADVEIDASGVDLSAADVRDVALLEGVIWTRKTTWPPGEVKRIRAYSKEIRPGVFKVRSGIARDAVLVPG
jgi:hypothetical protein